MKYNSLFLLICLSISGCVQAKKINPNVYKCVSNDSNYIERCKLQDAKKLFQTEEIEYFHIQMGDDLLSSELPKYADTFISASENYCVMSVGISYADKPKSEDEMYEKIATCLIPQYQQLGSNLRNMTDSGTKAVIERITKSVNN